MAAASYPLYLVASDLKDILLYGRVHSEMVKEYWGRVLLPVSSTAADEEEVPLATLQLLYDQFKDTTTDSLAWEDN